MRQSVGYGPTALDAEHGLTKEERLRIAKVCYEDPVAFCRTFLPHLFPGEIAWFHRALLAILTRKSRFLLRYGELDRIEREFRTQDGRAIFEVERGPDGEPVDVRMNLGRFTLVIMPRGCGKTTIAGIAVPLYEILYQDVPFTAYVSHSGTHARMQLDNVRRELSGNGRVIAVFGYLRPEKSQDERWAYDMFETVTGMAMVARGAGAQIRGLNHRGMRPTKIIADDLEDKEAVATEAQRQKMREWAYGDLMPALPALDKRATIVAIGTLLHPECLLETWARDPQWTTVRLGALDSRGEPIWRTWMDREAIEALRRSYAQAGQLHTFSLEYMSLAVPPESQVFRREWFVVEDPPKEGFVATAIYVDPAISQSERADSTVIVVCGMAHDGRIWVLDVWGKRGATPRETIDRYFEMSRRWGCTFHGVEAIAYQAALVHTMREEMFRKKHYFEITEVKHTSRKSERILGILQGRYAAGVMRHARPFPELEVQLLDYNPNLREQPDDYPDALAGCVALLDPVCGVAAGSAPEEPEMEPLNVEEYRWI